MTEPTLVDVPRSPKKNNRKTILWIGVALVLLCMCLIGAWIFYAYLGDPLLQYLGLG